MPAPNPKRWIALAFIALAQFVVIMDSSIVVVALPEIQADLGFSQAELSWMLNGFIVAFGGLLLLGGRLADLFGAKRIFAVGWLILLAGSVLAGVAGSPGVEIAGRAIQGVGAALIAPAALTLLVVLFIAQPKEFTKALAVYGAAAAAGGTAGVFLGGAITEWLSWRWVFGLYVPIALIALAAVPTLLPSTPAQRGRIDLLGAVTITGGVAAIVFGVVRAPEEGWGSTATILVLAGGIALIGLFVVTQSAVKAPLMRLGIFKTPNLAAANVTLFMVGGASVPMWYFLTLYLQQVLGYGPFATGAALLPMTVFIAVGMMAVAPRLIDRLGPKPLMVAGPLVLAAGLVFLSLAGAEGSYAGSVLWASIIAASGQALAFVPSLGMAISGVRDEESGLASGIINTNYQLGMAIGLAALAVLAVSQGADQLGDPQALTDGFSAGFLGAAGIAAAGGVAAALLVRPPQGPREEPAAEQPEPPVGEPALHAG